MCNMYIYIFANRFVHIVFVLTKCVAVHFVQIKVCDLTFKKMYYFDSTNISSKMIASLTNIIQKEKLVKHY